MNSFLFVCLLLAFQSTQAQTYCTPNYNYDGCSAGMNLSNVYLAGESITLDNTSTCNSTYYEDYTSSTSVNQPDLKQGEDYYLKLTTGYVVSQFCEIKAWIDYNNDGIFSTSEEIAFSNGNGLGTQKTDSFLFSVPNTAAVGTHRLRVRLVYAPASSFDACDPQNFGEAEDYLIEVIAGSNTCSGQPSAGVIQGADTQSLCSNSSLTLESLNPSSSQGISYQWQEGQGGVWISINNAHATTYEVQGSTLSTPTDYRLISTCSNSSLSDTSNIIRVEPNINPLTCYCIPEGTNSNRFIDSFYTLNAVHNISNNGSGFASGGYDVFTLDTIQQYLGETLDFRATYAGGQFGFKAWVDWNRDGQFDTTELVYSSNSFVEGLLGAFHIPDSLSAGEVRMRIGISNLSRFGPPGPCERGYSQGEFEDYQLRLLPLDSCSARPSAGTLADSVLVCGGYPFLLESIGATSSAGVIGLRGQWQMQNPLNTGTWQDIPGATAVSSRLANMPNNAVGFRFIYTCDTLSDTTNVMVTELKAAQDCYCTPEGTDPNRYINSFVTTGNIRDINHNNSGFSTGGYGDFTTDTVEQKRGHHLAFATQVKGGHAGMKIWVDLDRNGHFNSSNELVYESNGFDTLISDHFLVPHEALEGPLRMRIGTSRFSSGGPSDPCIENYDEGEFEDYILSVLPCDTPDMTISPNAVICEGDEVVLKVESNTNVSVDWNTQERGDSIIVDSSGRYYAVITDIYGCQNSDTVEVTVNPLPFVDHISSQWVRHNTYQFEASGAQDIDHYFWQFGDGNNSMDPAPEHTYSQEGTYEVTLYASNECGTDTLSTTVAIQTGIEVTSLSEESVKVYPNPAKEYLILKVVDRRHLNQIRVYNNLGQSVYTARKVSGKTYQLPISSLAPGIYKVQISFHEGGQVTKTIEVLR